MKVEEERRKVQVWVNSGKQYILVNLLDISTNTSFQSVEFIHVEMLEDFSIQVKTYETTKFRARQNRNYYW